MRLAVCLLFPALLGFAQTAPTSDDSCTVEGQVLNAMTGEPVRKASVTLESMGGGRGAPAGGMMFLSNYATATDAAGKFAMRNIPPGEYRLMASRNGFVNGSYGAHGHNRSGSPVMLAHQQHLTGMDIHLTPQGVVSGRVLDQDGDPLEYASVQIGTYRYTQGHKQLQPSGFANTNDLGEFRIFGISPGKYVLFATASNNGRQNTIDASATPAPAEDYVPTYYPGTPDPAAAAPLDIGPGAQIRGIDIALAKTRIIHVKGHVTTPQGARNTFIFVSPRSGGTPMALSRRTAVDRNGNFDLRVTPGAYYLTANSIVPGNASYSARVPLDASSSDIDGLSLVVSPGSEVTGSVAVASDSDTQVPSTLRIGLLPRESEPMINGYSPGTVKDGAFKVENISPGMYTVTVMGLPAGYYVKSIRTDEADVLASGLDMTSGAPAAIHIVISPNAPTVTGTVQDAASGNPAVGAIVVLVPQEKERKENTQAYRMATTDQNGSFSMASLQPGEYKAYAWEDIDYGAYMDPDFMKPFEDQGEAVSIKEGDRKTVSLKMIPADR